MSQISATSEASVPVSVVVHGAITAWVFQSFSMHGGVWMQPVTLPMNLPLLPTWYCAGGKCTTGAGTGRDAEGEETASDGGSAVSSAF